MTKASQELTTPPPILQRSEMTYTLHGLRPLAFILDELAILLTYRDISAIRMQLPHRYSAPHLAAGILRPL